MGKVGQSIEPLGSLRLISDSFTDRIAVACFVEGTYRFVFLDAFTWVNALHRV